MNAQPKNINQQSGILFFDGICNLCNNTVQFLIKRDKRDIFKFASLQSKFGQDFCKSHGISVNELTSVIYFKNKKVYQKSSAALHAFNDLGGLWKGFFILLIVPKFIRDFIYDLIAKNRYRFFGKRAECMLPTPELKAKFLE